MITPSLTDAIVAPLDLRVEIIPDKADRTASQATASNPEARPTLARPTLAAAGLFQGWGPRLR
jgi:hypothetical protein